MSERKAISMTGTLQDAVIQLSEGNPGGLSVLIEILKESPTPGLGGGFGLILDLDDMNIWGSQIWVGFKDHCGGDLQRFMKAAYNRCPEMVKTINSNSDGDEVAVIRGASFGRVI